MKDIRKEVAGKIIAKRDESLVTLALSRYPFNEDLLMLNSNIQKGQTITEDDRMYVQLLLATYQAPPMESVEQITYKEKIEEIIDAAQDRTSIIMLTIKEQINQGVSLNQDQKKVMEVWEQIYQTA